MMLIDSGSPARGRSEFRSQFSLAEYRSRDTILARIVWCDSESRVVFVNFFRTNELIKTRVPAVLLGIRI